MARSRSGTRNTRGPRKPPRRPDQQSDSSVQTLDPSARSPIEIPNSITVKELADTLRVNPADVIRELIKSGIFASINQPLDRDTAALVTSELGFEVAEQRAIVQTGAAAESNGEAPTPQAAKEVLFEADDPSLLQPRAPIVTVMGHVDHGKTSLLDAIRATEVAAGERGGITQHIGASEINKDGKRVVFLDTPGHEAFTAMRARGAKVTDIAVLVVAADDGVMPQTLEAIDHAKAANVPIVVALNKIDRPDATPAKVRQELAAQGLQPEEGGGETVFVDVSAKQKEGLDQLLEMLLLQSDVLELKANPNAEASGVIIESRLDVGRGPVATLLVQRGTLRVGDAVVAGDAWGRVKALNDHNGKRVKEAGPAVPVEILGFDKPPPAGEFCHVVENDRIARQMAQKRAQRIRTEMLARRNKAVSLEDLFSAVQEGAVQELGLIIKADVQGSVEAAEGEIAKIQHPEVTVSVIHSGVGGITASDINLAAASNAIVVGFNVRPNAEAKALAEREGVDIRTYKVIYQLTEDIQQALIGMLAPEQVEEIMGEAEVRQTFKVSRLGTIAGCMVTSGVIQRGAQVRLVRDGAIVHDGRIATLRRVQDDVREVQQGFECGLTIEGYNDVKEGDVLEAYTVREVARTS